MYGSNYGYRSGLNQSMINHLKKRAQLAMEIAKPEKGDVILDIGSNDSTSLRNYSSDLKLIGMDPSGTKFLKYYPEHVKLIPDFFNAANFRKNMQNEKEALIEEKEGLEEDKREIESKLRNVESISKIKI